MMHYQKKPTGLFYSLNFSPRLAIAPRDEKSGRQDTAIELFIAGVRSCEAGLRRAVEGGADNAFRQ
jgi:hypothetical protein